MRAGDKELAMASLGQTGKDADETIDLRDDAPGRPGHCPVCGAEGYLDRIDLRSGVQQEHCRACGCRWQRSIGDLAFDIEIIEPPSS